MELPLIGHLPGTVVTRSPEPERVYLSNPDWTIDSRGPLLLWDTFGGEFSVNLARPGESGWESELRIDGVMHAHLIHLPERDLSLVLGVHQGGRPRSIELWYRDGEDPWRGPIELFGGADFHAGSTPWAIWGDRLLVPFEVQQTGHWGSYQYGCVHAPLAADLRRPGSWTLALARVPWTAFPDAADCGALEGNLVVAPDGELYNFLRLPAQSRLGRARWNGCGWDWLGLVQGVHNQSKPEVFSGPGGWYLLANGWPDRSASGVAHAQRNTLCLWQATEPDLSRWRLLRVIASDHDPRHAFSYAAAVVADDRLLVAERHGDDQTHSFHDTNAVVVRERAGFAGWVEEPALVPYGSDAMDEAGQWVKANAQDGLLLSHLDGASYPLQLTCSVRLEAPPAEVGVLDLLGFATCDLVLIAGVQLVDQGRGPELAFSTGGRRVTLRERVAAGDELDLRLTLLSPVRAEAQVDQDTPVRARTHLASDPTLAGILPRADRPSADLGRVVVTRRPALAAGDEAAVSPEIPGALILADGRGVTRALPGNLPAPVDNLVTDGPLVSGGHPQFLEPWAGGLMAGPDQAALWSPLDAVPGSFSFGGAVRVMDTGEWTCVLAAFGQRTPEASLRRDAPYLALLLVSGKDAGARLAVAWRTDGDPQMVLASEAVKPWLTYALTAASGADGLAVKVYAGETDEGATLVSELTVPAEAVAGARHWLALIGRRGGEVRGFGGVFLSDQALDAAVVEAIAQAGFVTRMDTWPHRRPTCADALPSEPSPAPADPAPGTGG